MLASSSFQNTSSITKFTVQNFPRKQEKAHMDSGCPEPLLHQGVISRPCLSHREGLWLIFLSFIFQFSDLCNFSLTAYFHMWFQMCPI